MQRTINGNTASSDIFNESIDGYKRQTGRTTRMFNQAIMVAKAGSAVTVLMKDKYSVDQWKQKIGPVDGLEIIGAKVDMSKVINWTTLRLVGEKANNTLFIDHDVFYAHFKHIMNEFCRYDAPLEAVVFQDTPTLA